MPGNPFYASRFWKTLRQEVLKRDGYRCTVEGCPNTAATGRLYVDHIKTRPPVAIPTAADHPSNLRTLCGVHDAQVKETRDGRRSNNGQLRAIGCDASGFPLDPSHHWRKGERI